MSDTTETIESMASTRNSSIVPCAACNNDPANTTRLKNLEAEVLLLRDKAAAAADKLADYEEELHHLRRQDGPARTDTPIEQRRGSSLARATSTTPPRPEISRTATAPHTLPSSAAGRFSFLQGSFAAKPLPTPPVAQDNVAELEAALARETHLREEAEKKVVDVENEIEDLSATLFEQANEMVATERRARAKLEEKVVMLEKKDKERTRRLDRIDEAMKRLERVKTLLAP